MPNDGKEEDRDREESAENDAIKVEAEEGIRDVQSDDPCTSTTEKRKLTYFSLMEHLRWFTLNQLLISESSPAFRSLIHWFHQNNPKSDLCLSSSSMYRLANHNLVCSLIAWEKLCKDQRGLADHVHLMQALHFRELATLFTWQIRVNHLVALEQ